jgi:hypothetical protein
MVSRAGWRLAKGADDLGFLAAEPGPHEVETIALPAGRAMVPRPKAIRDAMELIWETFHQPNALSSPLRSVSPRKAVWT